MQEIVIREDFIRLDSALKLAGFVETGGHAKLVIQDGQVTVNGQACLMRGKKLRAGDTACFDGKELKVLNAG